MSSQGKGGKVEKQKGSVNNSRVPMRSPNNTGASRNSPAGGGGAGAKPQGNDKHQYKKAVRVTQKL